MSKYIIFKGMVSNMKRSLNYKLVNTLIPDHEFFFGKGPKSSIVICS